MDEPASPARETLAPEPPLPRPLSKLQKWVYSILAGVGLALIALTFILLEKNLPGFVIGGLAGAGGSLVAMSFMQLFHRPDR